jgi:hypothetical protein
VEGTVFDARAALFWAAASGVVPNSVRDALVEQAASTRTASKMAERVDVFLPSHRRAIE